MALLLGLLHLLGYVYGAAAFRALYPERLYPVYILPLERGLDLAMLHAMRTIHHDTGKKALLVFLLLHPIAAFRADILAGANLHLSALVISGLAHLGLAAFAARTPLDPAEDLALTHSPVSPVNQIIHRIGNIHYPTTDALLNIANK